MGLFSYFLISRLIKLFEKPIEGFSGVELEERWEIAFPESGFALFFEYSKTAVKRVLIWTAQFPLLDELLHYLHAYPDKIDGIGDAECHSYK